MNSIRTKSKDTNLIDKRRRMIAERARQIFIKTGFSATTIEQIASACHMTSGNIYRYIGTKKDILSLLCQYSVESTNSFIADREAAQCGDVIKDLNEAIQSFFRMCDKEWTDGIVIYTREQINLDTDGMLLLTKTRQGISNIFKELIMKGNEQGVFQVENPELLAQHIMFAGYDWAIRRLYLKGICDLNKYTQLHQEMIMKYAMEKPWS